jgi:hypothetical protein
MHYTVARWRQQYCGDFLLFNHGCSLYTMLMVKKATKKQKQPLHKTLLKWGAWILGIIIIIAGAIYIAFQVSPWPSALLLRDAFEKNATELSGRLEKYVPANISSTTNLQYKAGDKDGFLDA